MVATALFSVVITLIQQPLNFISSFSLVALYTFWVTLPAIFIICLRRKRLNSAPHLTRLMVVLACFLVPFLLTEAASQIYFSDQANFHLDVNQLTTRLIAAVIVMLLIIRWFAILSVLEHRNKAEMAQRFEALQSRIQPHFLFNSLNTITELIAIDPKQAEQAIQSLALLFRANLETKTKFHSLEAELNLCRRYLTLEEWRLGKRLSVEFVNKVVEPAVHAVPKLLLQPLIENAVLHGTGIDGRVDIKIDIRETRTELSVNINNGFQMSANSQRGHGVSLDNIRERLFVLYDDKAMFRVKHGKTHYDVLMRIPKQSLTQVSN